MRIRIKQTPQSLLEAKKLVLNTAYLGKEAVQKKILQSKKTNVNRKVKLM